MDSSTVCQFPQGGNVGFRQSLASASAHPYDSTKAEYTHFKSLAQSRHTREGGSPEVLDLIENMRLSFSRK